MTNNDVTVPRGMPMHRCTPVCTLAVVAGVLGIACSNPLKPETVAGVYILERVESDTLPAVFWLGSDEIGRVLADTILLRDNGTGLRVRLSQLESGGTVQPQERHEADFHYAIHGVRIEIAYPCNDASRCAPPPHAIARVLQGGLVIEYEPSSRVPQFFLRRDPGIQRHTAF